MYDAFLASYKSDDLVIKKKVLTIKKKPLVWHTLRITATQTAKSSNKKLVRENQSID